MNKRRLRLCRQRGWSHGSNVPEARFGGQWFADQGFNVGDFIDLILEENQIIIRRTSEEESRQLVEARSKWKR